MDSQVIEEILDELDGIFQNADTGAAALRLLKDKGIVNDDELAPYLEQAATASSVKWRAARLRLARLLESAAKSVEDELTEKQRKAQDEAKAAEQHDRKSRRGPRPEPKSDTKPERQEDAISETPAKEEAQGEKHGPSAEKETKPKHETPSADASAGKPTTTPPQDKKEPGQEKKEHRSDTERHDSREVSKHKPAAEEKASPQPPRTAEKHQPAEGQSAEPERKPA